MIKKLLVLSIAALVVLGVAGCALTTVPETTEETTTTSSTGTTTTQTPLVDLIPTECSGIAIVDGWVPVWCDEFTEKTPGTIVDTTKWTYQTGGGGFGNQELQYYTGADPDNIDIRDGNLVITARKETYFSNSYTSDKIWTQATASWKYGKIEMRAKLPGGRGTWPAFWMMPASSRYGNWPDSGEIDIMEHVGYDMDTVFGTVHTERFYGTNGRGGTTDSLIDDGLIEPFDVMDDFHTYGIVWNEDKIEWYFDGQVFASVEADEKWRSGYSLETSVDWPFDQRFYLILNLAVGGTWGGAQGVDTTIFPRSLTVDYVRVFQQDYATGDVAVPSAISSPRILWHDGKLAFISWNPSTDDMRIRSYHVFVNGRLTKSTSVPGCLLKTLDAEADNIIMIIAEDYAGNVSDAYEMLIVA